MNKRERKVNIFLVNELAVLTFFFNIASNRTLRCICALKSLERLKVLLDIERINYYRNLSGNLQYIWM